MTYTEHTTALNGRIRIRFNDTNQTWEGCYVHDNGEQSSWKVTKTPRNAEQARWYFIGYFGQ